MIDQWYEKYSGELTRYIRGRGFTQEDAEDLCSQVFLEAVKYQPADIAPRAWLYARAKSRAIDCYHSNRRRETLPFEEWSATVDAPEVQETTTQAALLMLLPSHQRVIEARFLRDRELSDVAAELGISVGAVKALQHRGLENLKRQFQGLAFPQHSLPHDRNWTALEIERLRLGIAQGWSEQSIGKWLGRTPTAIHIKTSRLGISRRAPTTGTAGAVAAALGVGCAKTVTRWAMMGWLPSQRSSDEHGAVWRFLWADVWAFCENPAYWMAWRPERIGDSARRTWAMGLRKGHPQWLTPGEVAKRHHVMRNVVNSWVTRFGLPATRYGNWWINEKDLEGWVAPGERPRTPRPTKPNDVPGWVSTADVAARYGMNRGQPQRWIHRGFVQGTRKGRCWWIHEDDLVGWTPPRLQAKDGRDGGS